jgi:hypothetical protein
MPERGTSGITGPEMQFMSVGKGFEGKRQVDPYIDFFSPDITITHPQTHEVFLDPTVPYKLSWSILEAETDLVSTLYFTAPLVKLFTPIPDEAYSVSADGIFRAYPRFRPEIERPTPVYIVDREGGDGGLRDFSNMLDEQIESRRELLDEGLDTGGVDRDYGANSEVGFSYNAGEYSDGPSNSEVGFSYSFGDYSDGLDASLDLDRSGLSTDDE